MGMQLNVLRGQFATVKRGDQFESVFHSCSVRHFSCLDNLFLDVRSNDASNATDSPWHGLNYMVISEHKDASHSRIDHNCHWKDLHAFPGPLSAYVQWGKELLNCSTADKEGVTLAEFFAKTGYEQHGLAPPSYFTLVANPLRFDFRPLPDSPLLGAGRRLPRASGRLPLRSRRGQRPPAVHLQGERAGHDGPAAGPAADDRGRPGPAARARRPIISRPMASTGRGRGSRAAPWATADYAMARDEARRPAGAPGTARTGSRS